MNAKKTFSVSALAVLTIGVVSFLFANLMYFAFSLLQGEYPFFGSDHATWIIQITAMYVTAIPAALCVMLFLPKYAPEKRSLGAAEFFRYLLCSFPLLAAGNLVGTLLTLVLTLGRSASNPVQQILTENQSPLMYVTVVLIAPVLEELFFRKVLIDRLAVYGEKNAILFSAILFGIFHGNIGQLFYAALIGLLFGYVYVRTGKIRYSILIHVIINFIGSVVSVFVLKLFQPEALTSALKSGSLDRILEQIPPLLAVGAYFISYYGLVALGVVMLVKTIRRLTFAPAALEIEKGKRIKTVYVNAGFIILSVYCLIKIVIALLT